MILSFVVRLGGYLARKRVKITSSAVATDGTQGVAYPGFTFTSPSAGVTWSASGLPPGLSLNPSTGVLSGTPTVSGAYTPTVFAHSAKGRPGQLTVGLVVVPGFSFSNTLGQANDTLSLQYAGSALTVYRPVLVPWSYTGTIFVATTGNDTTGNGTSGNPYRTISKAASVANPGDVVQIAAGTYVEQVVVSRSGTAGNPITFTIANGAAVGSVLLKLSATAAVAGTGAPNFWISQANWVTVNGLAFEGYQGRTGPGFNWPYNYPEHFTAANVLIRGATSGAGCNNVVQNCVGYNAAHCGAKVADSGPGICTGNLIRGNVWLGGGTNGTDHGTYVTADTNTTDGNVMAGWPGWGIHSYNGNENSNSPSAQTITNNLAILGTGTGGGGVLLASHGDTVAGNTSYGDATGTMYFRAGCFSNAVSRNVNANSTVQDSGVDRSSGNSNPANNADSSNVYFPGGVNSYLNGSNGNTATNALNADPLLLSPPGDCRLGGNSPAYGWGCYGSNWTLQMFPASLPGATGGLGYGPVFFSASPLSGSSSSASPQRSSGSSPGPYTFTLLYGSLPPGVSLTPGGVLSGTPSTSGNFTFAVQARDGQGRRVVNVYTLVVSPVLYVYDSFTDVNGTLLTAHTPDLTQGSGWAAVVGTSLQIQSGAAVQTAGGARMEIDGAHADGRALVDFSFAGSLSQNFLTFRYGDNNNMWQLGINSGAPQWVLNKTASGSTTTVTSGSASFSAGTTYTLESRFSGSSISVYINGSLLTTITDSFNSAATKCGMTSGGTSPSFKNFKISAFS